MKRFLPLFLAGLLAAPIPVDAGFHRGNSQSSSLYPGCPFGLATPDDKCQALYDMGLVGSWQNSNCFSDATCAKGSSQTYNYILQENKAGVDYGTGLPQIDVGNLKDPATADLTGTGCAPWDPLGAIWATSPNGSISGTTLTWTSLSAAAVIQVGEKVTGSGVTANTLITAQIDATHWTVNNSQTISSRALTFLGGPKIICGSGGLAVVIKQFEFGAIGGHLGTVLRIAHDAISSDIQRNDFLNDANTANASNQNDYALYLAESGGASFDSVFSHNTVNGQCFTLIGCTNFQIVFSSSGKKTWWYNAWVYLPFRISAGCPSTCATVGDLDFEGSIWIGPVASQNNNHGEWIEEIFAQSGTPTTQAHTWYIGNTIISPAGAAVGLTTTMLYISGGATPVWPATYSDVRITDSSIVCNKTTGSAVCSSLIDFQNGKFVNILLKNLGMDVSGAGNNVRADCINSIWSAGSVVGATGVLTMTGHINTGGWGLTLNNSEYYSGATRLGIILSQSSGTTGKDGTYNTDYRGADIAATGMAAYGGQGTATFPNGMTFTNVKSMLSGASITSVDFKNACATPFGPVPP